MESSAHYDSLGSLLAQQHSESEPASLARPASTATPNGWMTSVGGGGSAGGGGSRCKFGITLLRILRPGAIEVEEIRMMMILAVSTTR